MGIIPKSLFSLLPCRSFPHTATLMLCQWEWIREVVFWTEEAFQHAQQQSNEEPDEKEEAIVQFGAWRNKNVLILMSDTSCRHRASAEAIHDTFRMEFGNKYHVGESFFKRPRTLPTNNTSTCRLADEDKVPKGPRHGETSNESFSSSNDFPKQVAKTLNQGSYVQSMDFHPSQPALLLVGTNVGDVAVWEITLGERLVLNKFEVWNLPACSVSCKFWDAITGEIQYTWDGHEAPVLSISSRITKIFQVAHLPDQ